MVQCAGARIETGALVVPVDGEFELLFRLTGTHGLRTRVELRAALGRDEVIRDVMLQRQPSKQFATVEQIGGTALFLCSDAADQITGTTISVDGGWTAL